MGPRRPRLENELVAKHWTERLWWLWPVLAALAGVAGAIVLADWLNSCREWACPSCAVEIGYRQADCPSCGTGVVWS